MYYCRLLAWLQEKTLVVIECGVIAVRLAWRKFISWKLTPYTILSDYLIFWHVLTFLGTVTVALCKRKKIPHIRLILKLTYLKLFLDMALSSPRIILPHASWMFCVEDDDAC